MSDTTTPSAPPVPEPTPYAAPAPPPATRSALPLWALVVSIVAIVSAIIPGLSFVAWLPAIAAPILGIIGLVSNATATARNMKQCAG
ncbi:MAG: hypothetical protein ACOH1T_00350 [Microbacteriaceae bacterium]